MPPVSSLDSRCDNPNKYVHNYPYVDGIPLVVSLCGKCGIPLFVFLPEHGEVWIYARRCKIDMKEYDRKENDHWQILTHNPGTVDNWLSGIVYPCGVRPCFTSMSGARGFYAVSYSSQDRGNRRDSYQDTEDVCQLANDIPGLPLYVLSSVLGS